MLQLVEGLEVGRVHVLVAVGAVVEVGEHHRLLVAFIVIYFVTSNMVRPLQDMLAATRSFSKGDFSIRVLVEGDAGGIGAEQRLALHVHQEDIGVDGLALQLVEGLEVGRVHVLVAVGAATTS